MDIQVGLFRGLGLRLETLQIEENMSEEWLESWFHHLR